MSGGKLTVADALLMRSMVDWPGGLELHIGVRARELFAGNSPAIDRACMNKAAG